MFAESLLRLPANSLTPCSMRDLILELYVENDNVTLAFSALSHTGVHTGIHMHIYHEHIHYTSMCPYTHPMINMLSKKKKCKV